jgi:hypothetical protein
LQVALEIDLPSKAVSFEHADEARQRKGGAFMRHKKKGHFVLAIESGRHTDPATGNSYRTFALWKPEAPHANYIHDDELNKKYKAGGQSGSATGGQRNTRPCQRLKRSSLTS